MLLKDVRNLFSFKTEEEKKEFFLLYLSKREKDFGNIGVVKKEIRVKVKGKGSKDKKVKVTESQFKLLKTLKLI